MFIRPIFLSFALLASLSAEVIEINDNGRFEKEVLNSDVPVVVDFYATWCGPCKATHPTVEKVAAKRKDVKLVKVDVDKGKDVSNNHKVRSMPTFVVFHKGKEIGRFTGAQTSEDALHKKIDEIVKAKASAKKPEAPVKPAEKPKADKVEMPAPSKEETLIQQYMTSLMTGDVEGAKKLLDKETVNYMIETPEIDFTPLSLAILMGSDDALIDHILGLKPNLTKEIKMNNKKQTISKHLDDMAKEARKNADKHEKLAKKLAK